MPPGIDQPQFPTLLFYAGSCRYPFSHHHTAKNNNRSQTSRFLCCGCRSWQLVLPNARTGFLKPCTMHPPRYPLLGLLHRYPRKSNATVCSTVSSSSLFSFPPLPSPQCGSLGEQCLRGCGKLAEYLAMPCKIASHSDHLWPIGPPPGSGTYSFFIEDCEYLCVYCQPMSFCKHPSPFALKKHVQGVHLSKGQYPGIKVTLRNEGTLARLKPPSQVRKPNTISIPHTLKAAHVYVPVDAGLPASQRLAVLHTLLQIKPVYHTLFQALATRHLFSKYDLSQLYSGPQTELRNPLAPPAVSFLHAYGDRLWPAESTLRSHLFDVTLSSQPGNFWAFKYGCFGPDFKVDSAPNPSAVAWWRHKLGGEVLDAEQYIGLSKLGAVMLVYFAALVDADDATATFSTEPEGEILNRILGTRKPVDVAMLEFERDSSPEVPLRIAAARRKSNEARTSAVVVLPALPHHRPSSYPGKPFCILEGCYHGRKDCGVMVACGKENCPIEWFHPECVGLHGKELKELEWICLGCREAPSIHLSTDEHHGMGFGSRRQINPDELMDTARDFATGHSDQEALLQNQRDSLGTAAESRRSLLSTDSASGDSPGTDLPAVSVECSLIPASRGVAGQVEVDLTTEAAGSTPRASNRDTNAAEEVTAATVHNNDTSIDIMQQSTSNNRRSNHAQVPARTVPPTHIRFDDEAVPENNGEEPTDIESDVLLVQASTTSDSQLNDEAQRQRLIAGHMHQQRARGRGPTRSHRPRGNTQAARTIVRAPSFAVHAAGGAGRGSRRANTPQRPVQSAYRTLLPAPVPARTPFPTSVAMTAAPWQQQPFRQYAIPQGGDSQQPSALIPLPPRPASGSYPNGPNVDPAAQSDETTAEEECTPEMRAWIAWFLEMTGGMGGLPLS
uniref:Zinc finger PHD-type domain-containing protein n=1 Tax=Ramularia collo-cygni TaxID=112498 RepID=A0A2D3V4L4_9PEZI